MLLVKTDLQSFANLHVSERTNLENNFMVASDDELTKLYKDTVNDGNNCTLVTVIPTADANILDEDNRRFRNNLIFMIIKKTDAKAGSDHRIDVFQLCQEEILALTNKIIDLHHNFNQNCLFRDIDLNSIRIDPVQDYLGANGFALEFSVYTILQKNQAI
ncbi:hypothetical protein [Abyssalbus ytuae]|uniref:Uncharacterized protein n=1 Tax=Abyssalbus ytuae TaxID=2926907 RepID=A0A9E6ZLV3_9FLAO|nr:hypothetical protein [Abyssalbus ytuae]UOB16575.1 hypothetical protein MQE35_12620 [Abyssalbus ytuae]